jgi:predicted phosphodiesterase
VSAADDEFQAAQAGQPQSPMSRARRNLLYGKIAGLLERSGIDVDDVGRVQKVNVWQGFYKDAAGDAQQVDMAGVQLLPKWADGPAWPVIQPGPRVRLPKSQVAIGRAGSWDKAVVLPDIQFGYYRESDEGLTAIHDEEAVDIALRIIRQIRPAKIVMVGDNLDLAEFGRYRLSPAFQRTTQATIDRATLFGAQLRAASPDAEIIWLAGNHEERLPNYVLDNARAAFGVKRAGEKWPVLSVPHLCRLDDHGIEFRPGYPAAHVWLNERIRVIHGELVRSNGMTAHRYLAREKVSVVYGHIHRREWAEVTREDHDGRPATILAMSPGTLARIDGAVPSTKGGIDLDGRPLRRHEDWQQGIAVITYEPGDGRFYVEQVPIHSGWAMYRDREYGAA